MAEPRVETLAADLERKATLTGSNGAAPPSLEHVLNGSASAQMPPAMAEIKEQTADEVLQMMNRMPLFMTDMDDINDENGENIQLEAIKALAYEGTRSEIASNFREQGNEAAKQKLWKDAREFYDKAVDTLRMTDQQLDEVKGGEGPSDFEVIDIDEQEEAQKCKQILEASLVNRALCNLELKNYGSCIRDCATALKANPSNVKAWYRSASACLALDKTSEAAEACARGLQVDATNAALASLSARIAARQKHLDDLARTRAAREEKRRREAATLAHALKARNVLTRSTDEAPDTGAASVSLEDAGNAASRLRVPTMLLYPLAEQSDFVERFGEDESVGEHLAYILPAPWDERGEYTAEGVECYVESVSGGLLKVGKKLALLRVLNTGKVEILDGLLKIYVVPRGKVDGWIETFKTRRGRR